MGNYLPPSVHPRDSLLRTRSFAAGISVLRSRAYSSTLSILDSQPTRTSKVAQIPERVFTVARERELPESKALFPSKAEQRLKSRPTHSTLRSSHVSRVIFPARRQGELPRTRKHCSAGKREDA